MQTMLVIAESADKQITLLIISYDGFLVQRAHKLFVLGDSLGVGLDVLFLPNHMVCENRLVVLGMLIAKILHT